MGMVASRKKELVNDAIGDPLALDDSDRDTITENAASKVSGRMAVLPTDEQQRFYDDMVERYRNYVAYLLQTGEYDLEVDTGSDNRTHSKNCREWRLQEFRGKYLHRKVRGQYSQKTVQ